MGFIHLLLGLFLYLVALDDSFVNAQIIGVIDNNGKGETVVNKDLSKDTTMVGAAANSKWMRGRKMQLGAEGALEKKVDGMQVKGPEEETGKINVPSKKLLYSATLHKKDITGLTRISNPTITVRKNAKQRTELGVRKIALHGSHYPLKKIGSSRKQVDAVTEMYNMLNRDYQIRARRRPPINNATPLH